MPCFFFLGGVPNRDFFLLIYLFYYSVAATLHRHRESPPFCLEKAAYFFINMHVFTPFSMFSHRKLWLCRNAKGDYLYLIEMKSCGHRDGRLVTSIHRVTIVVIPWVSFQVSNRIAKSASQPHDAAYKPMAMICMEIYFHQIEKITPARIPQFG